MSPTIVKVFDAVHKIVQAEYCALNFGADAVAPVDVIVTPEPCAKVTCPAPICCRCITFPAENTDGGTVTVIAEAFDAVTHFPKSPATKVYVVPV